MPAPTTTTPTTTLTTQPDSARCTCGAGTSAVDLTDRARRLVRLDRAVAAGLVTSAEAAERRVQLLAR
ncbi:MAG: hypothetical protein U0S36_09945 [Candidatus Nanopelagicales bacterium]|jgi:hypothetical protein